MSVHLHEVIDELRSKPYWNGISDPVAFHVGDISDYANIPVIHELIRLPYENCWFEMIYPNLNCGRHGVYGIAACNFMGLISCSVYLRDSKTSGWSYFVDFHIDNGAITDIFSIEDIDEDVDNTEKWRFIADPLISPVLSFISALNCTNVKRVINSPSPQLQKARARRGKAPLFSYWTLELDIGARKVACGSLGGTHASPRVHLRRGHPRQYAPGLWTWVQPHAVGNKSLGMVHKDYAVKPAEKWGQQ